MFAVLLWWDAGFPREADRGAEKWLPRLQAIRAGSCSCYKIMIDRGRTVLGAGCERNIATCPGSEHQLAVTPADNVLVAMYL